MSLRTVVLYTFHERAWHAVQAITILGLLVTGAEIHSPGQIQLLGFRTAVHTHNALAIVLLLNAAMGLFYFVTSGLIRQFGPRPRDFASMALAQIRYYTHGIFHGAPHPMQHGPDQKLNPLQQITYLAILNVLLPVQIASGVLIWSAAHWPALVDAFGGLTWLAPLHALAAWFFLAFSIMHVYLTTTGHTPTANLEAMVTGRMTVHEEHEEAAR